MLCHVVVIQLLDIIYIPLFYRTAPMGQYSCGLFCGYKQIAPMGHLKHM